MRRVKFALVASAFLAAATGIQAEQQDKGKDRLAYKLEEGSVLEFETSATFTSIRGEGVETWQHNAEYTVLATRSDSFDLFAKITPKQTARQRMRGYACDTVQLSPDGKILKQGQLLPQGIFPGWSVNFELPQLVNEENGATIDYRDPIMMLPLQAKVTKSVKDGVVTQKLVADPNSKVLEKLPLKIKVLEVENTFSEKEGLPLATHLQFDVVIQVSQDGTTREIALEGEAKRTGKSTMTKEALAKLKEDAALGVTTFKALREAVAGEGADTTGATKAIDAYLAKFPDGQFAPLLKDIRSQVELSVTQANNWAQIREGKIAPNFTTTALDGSAIDLAKLRGKVVVLDFWATWCGPCRQLVPKMKELYEQNKDKAFAMIGISADHSVDDLKEYVKDQEIAWPQVYEGDGGTTTVLHTYGVSKFPTLVVVDKKGVIRGVDVHPPELNELVEKLVKEEK
ncbi:MAG: TlpA family protein disulfide reductase [Candidatus Sumerlaeaceae bacterium]